MNYGYCNRCGSYNDNHTKDCPRGIDIATGIEIEQLRATVQEQYSEIASLYEMNLAQAKTIAEQAAENELLKQVEANLCELHNVALGEIADSQHKVKVLTDALEEIANDYADRFDLESPSTNPGIIDEALEAYGYTRDEAQTIATLARADLEAELESLRKDAERYRFIRDAQNSETIGVGVFDEGYRDWVFPFDPVDIDLTIDTAIAAAPKEK